MTSKAIRQAFEGGRSPLTFQLADGHKYVVRHRDFMFRTPKGDSVFLVTDEDRYHPLDTASNTKIAFAKRQASKQRSEQSRW